MNTNITNLAEFHEHVLDEYPKEAIGVLKEGIYTPLVNRHPDPFNNFLLSESDSFRLVSLGDYILIHSHTRSTLDTDSRSPSLEDMQSQVNLGRPFGIVHCDGEAVSDPLYFGPPSRAKLLGRQYIHNIYDCYTLGRDYYYRYFHVDTGVFPRPPDWQEWNPYAMEENYCRMGFKELDTRELQKGDVLLYKIASQQPNHIGIYLEEDRFIHHLYGRKSAEDSVKKWSKHLGKVLRYEDAVI